MIVGEVFPSRASRAVVFAHRAPLALGEIRPPALPVFLAVAGFLEPLVFLGLKSGHCVESLDRRSNYGLWSHLCELQRRPVRHACLFGHGSKNGANPPRVRCSRLPMVACNFLTLAGAGVTH